MSFTAHEYRVAAKVLKKEFEDKSSMSLKPSASEQLEAMAEKVDARENYAIMLDGLRIPSASPFYNGARIIDRLLNDGWTPPEGLF